MDGTPLSLAPTATDAIVGTSTVGIRGYIMNGFNGAGNSGSGDNGSVVQFLGEGRGGTGPVEACMEFALAIYWSNAGINCRIEIVILIFILLHAYSAWH